MMYSLAEKKYKRQQDLVKHGVGIQKELEEAETELRNKKDIPIQCLHSIKNL
jgi:multidrug resistance efflux pump